MKKILLLAIAIFTTQIVLGQASLNAIKSMPIRFDDAEIKPEFPGGFDQFMKFIGENYQTPDVEGISGSLKVSFIVETTGKISEILILKDLGSGTGEEAKRVISKSPNWIPGEKEGKLTRVLIELPIKIQSY